MAAVGAAFYVVFQLLCPFTHHDLFSNTVGTRLAIGWTMGTIASALGVYLSAAGSADRGATIVCTFGLVLILMAAMRPLFPNHSSVEIVQEVRKLTDVEVPYEVVVLRGGTRRARDRRRCGCRNADMDRMD